ncbi:ATP-grasp domain-containing protein [Lachnospiraceae bacterium 56-18]|uniref:ATP-grasp domain-containing protein n=1 Tax=Thomasclavelia cocleata TaxID=69824 RepID=UPI00272E8C03|nr:ATP-grasp domain-containing protein [Thomasclavelia cocleata]
MDLKEYTFIVFGEVYHYNPLGVVRSLGEEGICPILIAYGEREHVVSSSRYVKRSHHVKTIEEGYRILKDMYCKSIRKSILIVCDDIVNSYLDEHYDEIKDYFYFNNAGKQGRISKYQNKLVSNELAEKCGMRVPKTWFVKRGEIPKNLTYPIITKPITSYAGWKKDYYICNSEIDLKNAYEAVGCGEMILQTYIKKKNEFSVDGIVWNQGKEVFVSVKTLYTYLLPDYYSMEMVHSSFNDSEIQTFLERMFEEIRFEGIFSIDILIDENNNKWFLEINYRNSAWSYASTKLGMNLPVLWAKGMIDGSIGENVRKQVPDNYIALAEIMDFDLRVRKYHFINIFQWFTGVLKADCLYVWNWGDLKPVAVAWFSKLIRKIRRK